MLIIGIMTAIREVTHGLTLDAVSVMAVGNAIGYSIGVAIGMYSPGGHTSTCTSKMRGIAGRA